MESPSLTHPALLGHRARFVSLYLHSPHNRVTTQWHRRVTRDSICSVRSSATHRYVQHVPPLRLRSKHKGYMSVSSQGTLARRPSGFTTQLGTQSGTQPALHWESLLERTGEYLRATQHTQHTNNTRDRTGWDGTVRSGRLGGKEEWGSQHGHSG